MLKQEECTKVIGGEEGMPKGTKGRLNYYPRFCKRKIQYPGVYEKHNRPHDWRPFRSGDGGAVLPGG